MVKRTPLTTADQAAAARLSTIWHKSRPVGMTQEKAALLLGISQSAVSQCLQGKMVLNAKLTLAFAELLGVPPSEIRTDMPYHRNEANEGDLDKLIAMYRAASTHARRAISINVETIATLDRQSRSVDA